MIVVVLIEEIVSDAPVQAPFAPLKHADRIEVQITAIGPGQLVHEMDAIVAEVVASADLPTDAVFLPDREAEVRLEPAAHVGIDAQVLRLLATVHRTEDRQVAEQGLTPWLRFTDR